MKGADSIVVPIGADRDAVACDGAFGKFVDIVMKQAKKASLGSEVRVGRRRIDEMEAKNGGRLKLRDDE